MHFEILGEITLIEVIAEGRGIRNRSRLLKLYGKGHWRKIKAIPGLNMAERKMPLRRFAVCVRNKGYEASLERNKIYLVRSDPAAEKQGDLRIVDESGEDYLYPAKWFVALEVPKAVQDSLMKAS